MDMYAIALGDGNERGRLNLLAPYALNLFERDFGRFRDAWVEWDENQVLRIAVYTRNGGGNRPDYAAVTDALRQHPCYITDRDDDFDSTYATYYFHFPVTLPDHLREADEADEAFTQEEWNAFFTFCGQNAYPEPVDTSKRWQDAIENMRVNGPTARQEAAFEPIAKAMTQALDNADPNRGIPIIYTDGRVEYHKPEEKK